MNVTFSRPGDLNLSPQHVTEGGRMMVHIAEDGEKFAGLLWLAPEQAAQWIEALTPLAAQQ